MSDIDVEIQTACPHCQAPYQPGDAFCQICGKELVVEPRDDFGDVFVPLRPVLLYYFMLLLVLALYKFTDSFPDGLAGMIVITLVTVVITVAFTVESWATTRKLYSFSGVRWSILGLTIGGAMVGSLVVNMLCDFINASFHDDVFYNTYLFADTPYPLLFATLMIALEPAIFEEVAFRGFLFTSLARITKGVNAVYVSAFLFGIMHLSIISLIWLVPIGIAFAELRRRYDTLWYGMAGHFVYNFCIVLYEYFGI
ncbi:MAG: CPBP family intramembrane metalloprotease [Cyclobacteriaceae bacterium]|nr:CPBP family intramembrane metalloprotease [Cyclobacteriaceae bacterium]